MELYLTSLGTTIEDKEVKVTIGRVIVTYNKDPKRINLERRE